MYHPFPADFSLDQEHINSTEVDTHKYPNLSYIQNCLLPTAEGTLQPVEYCSSGISIQNSSYTVTMKKLIQMYCKCLDNCAAREQMKAGEENRKNKQLDLSSWYGENARDLETQLISSWPAGSKCWYLGHLNNFQMMTHKYINCLGDLLAAFLHRQESLTGTRDTAGDNQWKVFEEYSQMAEVIDPGQGCWGSQNASSPCSHLLLHS